MGQTGVDLVWVDSVLGAAPPGARTGDLATNTARGLDATVAIAKGCIQPGDHGGGLYYWDPAGGTDDGGTIIVPGASVGSTGPCWRRIYEGARSVRWFGATGNGADNDSHAIQQALNSAATHGGAVVSFPPGTYNADGLAIPDHNISVQGAGRASIIRKNSSANALFTVGALRHIIFRDFQVQSVSPPMGYAILFNQVGAIFNAIDSVYMTGVFRGIAIAVPPTPGLQGVNNTVIRNCFMDDVIDQGIYLKRAIDTDISDSGVFMRGQSGVGLVVDSQTEGLWVSNVVVTQGNPGILIQNTDGPAGGTNSPRQLFFSRTAADGCANACWQFSDGRRIHLVECWAASVVPGTSGIITASPCRSLEFENCIVLNCAREGYRLNSGTDIGIIGGEVISNSKDDPGAFDGIATGNHVDGIRIIGVKVRNDEDFVGRHRHAVTLNTGTNNVVVQACDLRGHLSGAINKGSGGQQFICNNLI